MVICIDDSISPSIFLLTEISTLPLVSIMIANLLAIALASIIISSLGLIGSTGILIVFSGLSDFFFDSL